GSRPQDQDALCRTGTRSRPFSLNARSPSRSPRLSAPPSVPREPAPQHGRCRTAPKTVLRRIFGVTAHLFRELADVTADAAGPPPRKASRFERPLSRGEAIVAHQTYHAAPAARDCQPGPPLLP